MDTEGSLPIGSHYAQAPEAQRKQTKALQRILEFLGIFWQIANMRRLLFHRIPTQRRKQLILVLRTAITAPVWRGRNRCFDVPYCSKNGIKISAELY